MENFSPELIRAQTEAELMKEKIKSGQAADYDEALSQIEAGQNSEVLRYSEQFKEVEQEIKSYKGDEQGRKELIQNYKNIIEEIFQGFASEVGSFKFNDAKDFLNCVDNFYEFLETNNITGSVDMAFRFNIETVLENADISEENKKAFKDYLLKISPYNFGDYDEREKCAEEMIQGFDDKNLLIGDMREIVRVSRTFDRIATGPKTILPRLGGDNFMKIMNLLSDGSINVYEGAEKKYIEIWEKENNRHARNAMTHANLHSTSVIDFRRKISLDFNLGHRINEKEEDEQDTRKIAELFRDNFGINLEEVVKKAIE